jgi:hypothetical protein
VPAPPFPEPVEGNSARSALAAVAYGRTDSAEDEARAAEARLALHELDLHAASERQALARAAREAIVARERRARRIRSRLLRGSGALAIIALLVAVGVVLLAPPQDRDASLFGGLPGTLPPTGSAAGAPSGGAANAQFWFDGPQTADDRTPTQLDRIDPDSTRAVDSDVEGWQIWVAKDVDDGLCLIVHETATEINGWSCKTPEQFAASGLLVTATGATPISAYWDGFDLHSESTPPGSASSKQGVTDRGQQADGRANAERWLNDPQEESDKLSSAPALIDAATTRAVDVGVAGWSVWVAKDHAGNFCIAVRESGTVEPAVACATPEVFDESGVEVSAVGTTSITAFWDGVIVQTGPNGPSFVPVEP